MKRITKLLILLVIALMAVSPAFAFGGISGTAIDADLNGWQWGGEVYVYNTNTGDVSAICFLSTNPANYGAIVDENGGPCNYGDDDTAGGTYNGTYAGAGFVTVNDPAHGVPMEVYIDFTPGPINDPADYTKTFTESDNGPLFEHRIQGLGYINTGVGPNAVTLNDFAAQSSSPALFVLAGVALLALASGALVIARKRLA